jgi:hypothetical protein
MALSILSTYVSTLNRFDKKWNKTREKRPRQIVQNPTMTRLTAETQLTNTKQLASPKLMVHCMAFSSGLWLEA